MRNTSVALVTGASRGLGRAVARAYAERGLRLVLTSRNAEHLAHTAAELSVKTDVVAYPGDVSDHQHVARLATAGIARFGQIDVLINNASELGPSPMPPLVELNSDELMTILRVNVAAPLELIQLTLPNMLQRHSGLIINVTSDAAVQPYPTWGGYGLSKAALEQMSRVLAAEVAGSGVRVYEVDPGDMNTAMHAAAEPGVDLSGLPSPESVAAAFVNLLDLPQESGRFEAQQIIRSRVVA